MIEIISRVLQAQPQMEALDILIHRQVQRQHVQTAIIHIDITRKLTNRRHHHQPKQPIFVMKAMNIEHIPAFDHHYHANRMIIESISLERPAMEREV